MAYYNKAIELDPFLPDSYYNRGILYQATGNRDAAIADYRNALEVDPNFELARQALSNLGV